MSGPSSRTIEMPIRSATKISAPKRRIGTADWNARISPSRNEISATIGGATDFLDDRRALRLGIEIVLEPRRVELLEQDLMRGFEVRDFDRRRARMRDQVDQQSNARAVAIIDSTGVDGDGTGRRVRQR